MYVLESGSLDCTKVFSGNSQPTHLKVYQPGEGFGELLDPRLGQETDDPARQTHARGEGQAEGDQRRLGERQRDRADDQAEHAAGDPELLGREGVDANVHAWTDVILASCVAKICGASRKNFLR